MAILDGNNTTERNKLIAAVVLGLVALVALYLAFGRSLFGPSTSAKVTVSPTPKRSVAPPNNGDNVMPAASEQQLANESTPIDYLPGSYAPDAGRNIFAFYEPPPPCRGAECPTPTPRPVIIETPKPTPSPPILLAYTNPQTVYAGSQGFRLEVNGDKFTPDARIYLNQVEMPTIFVNAQKMVTDLPANMIAQETQIQVIVQTPDGKSYSNPAMVAVQAPPRPVLQYIGMIGRKRYNNDTAYFTEQGKDTKPFGARLNDVVSGRFRLIDISTAEVVFQDVELGFKHRVQLTRSATGTATTGAPTRPGFPDGFNPVAPTVITPGNCPPGIPCNNVQPFTPQPQPRRTPADKKDDVDDDDDPN
jgi:hypothetical protein